MSSISGSSSSSSDLSIGISKVDALRKRADSEESVSSDFVIEMEEAGSDELFFDIQERVTEAHNPATEEWNIVRLLEKDKFLDFENVKITDLEFAQDREMIIKTMPNGTRKLFLRGSWKVNIDGDSVEYAVDLPTSQIVGYKDKESGRIINTVNLAQAKADALLKIKVQEQLFKRTILAAQDPGRYGGPVEEREKNVQRAAMRSLNALKESGVFKVDLKRGGVTYESAKGNKRAIASKNPLATRYKEKIAYFQIHGETMPGTAKTIHEIMKVYENSIRETAKRTEVKEDESVIDTSQGPTIEGLKSERESGMSVETALSQAGGKIDQLLKAFDNEAQYFTKPTGRAKKEYAPHMVRSATDHLYSNNDFCRNVANRFEQEKREQETFENLRDKDPATLTRKESRYLAELREKRLRPNYASEKMREDIREIHDYRFAQELTLARFDTLKKIREDLQEWFNFHADLYTKYKEDKIEELGDSEEAQEVIEDSKTTQQRRKIEKKFKTAVKFFTVRKQDADLAKTRENAVQEDITLELERLKEGIYATEEAIASQQNLPLKEKKS